MRFENAVNVAAHTCHVFLGSVPGLYDCKMFRPTHRSLWEKYAPGRCRSCAYRRNADIVDAIFRDFWSRLEFNITSRGRDHIPFMIILCFMPRYV